MARPRTYDELATRWVHVRVTDAQLAKLREVASEQRLPVTSVVREAVNTYVEDYREGDGPFRDTKSEQAGMMP